MGSLGGNDRAAGAVGGTRSPAANQPDTTITGWSLVHLCLSLCDLSHFSRENRHLASSYLSVQSESEVHKARAVIRSKEGEKEREYRTWLQFSGDVFCNTRVRVICTSIRPIWEFAKWMDNEREKSRIVKSAVKLAAALAWHGLVMGAL